MQYTPKQEKALSCAFRDAADTMGLSVKDMSLILRQPEHKLQDIFNEKARLRQGDALFEDALTFVRFYRDLSGLVGRNPDLVKHWLNTENCNFSQKPIERLKQPGGLKAVAAYIDHIKNAP